MSPLESGSGARHASRSDQVTWSAEWTGLATAPRRARWQSEGEPSSAGPREHVSGSAGEMPAPRPALDRHTPRRQAPSRPPNQVSPIAEEDLVAFDAPVAADRSRHSPSGPDPTCRPHPTASRTPLTLARICRTRADPPPRWSAHDAPARIAIRRLLVAQCLDRVELRRLPRWIIAEEDSDQRSKAERQNDCLDR